MNWGSASEFFAMGGYGLYVWGSFLMTAVALAWVARTMHDRFVKLARPQGEWAAQVAARLPQPARSWCWPRPRADNRRWTPRAFARRRTWTCSG